MAAAVMGFAPRSSPLAPRPSLHCGIERACPFPVIALVAWRGRPTPACRMHAHWADESDLTMRALEGISDERSPASAAYGGRMAATPIVTRGRSAEVRPVVPLPSYAQLEQGREARGEGRGEKQVPGLGAQASMPATPRAAPRPCPMPGCARDVERDNQHGICPAHTNRFRLANLSRRAAGLAEFTAAQYAALPRDAMGRVLVGFITSPRACHICGHAIRSDNTTGLCSRCAPPFARMNGRRARRGRPPLTVAEYVALPRAGGRLARGAAMAGGTAPANGRHEVN